MHRRKRTFGTRTVFDIGTVLGSAGLGVMIAAALTPAQAKQSHPHAGMDHKKITIAQAEAIVLHRFPGKLEGKTILEDEEGKWQYGVMVRSGHVLREVMVGAYNGKIENVEVTTTAREQVEKKADEAAARKGKAHH